MAFGPVVECLLDSIGWVLGYRGKFDSRRRSKRNDYVRDWFVRYRELGVSIKKRKKHQPRQVIGWREWVQLPQLGVPWVKCKVDTGARSSCLHAFDKKPFERDGKEWISFSVHPIQRKHVPIFKCEAEILEYRKIRSSNGQTEKRPVILSQVVLFGRSWEIELTLSNRDEMGFRMLLGRAALTGRFFVDPGKSFCLKA